MVLKKRSHEVTRRTTLRTLLGAAGAVFIPAWNETVEAADTITCVPQTPTVTEGPYWVDEKLFRSDIRTDPANGVARPGVTQKVVIKIQNLSAGGCTPLVGAYVDIWHCDAGGAYSDEPAGMGNPATSGQKFLRGYQITDENGQVQFTTIYPGWYSGRTIHIHVRVRTYNGSTVLSNFVSQIFFDEATNNTVLAQSAYRRAQGRDTMNSNDMVYNVANNTRMLATSTGNVTDGYTSAITMAATFQSPPAAIPVITSGGVANAVGGAAGVTPGSWISIYGANLATTTRLLAGSDLVNNTIPTSLAGVSAKINGKAAFVQYVSPTQVNVLAPADTSRGTVSVTITNAGGTSTAVTTNLVALLPGLSTASNYVRAVRTDGKIINGTGAAETGYQVSAAAGPGDAISLFGTGFGDTTTAVSDGLVFTGSYPTAAPVTVTVGGASATVLYAGLVGPGLYQINIIVPSLPDGDHAVVAFIGGTQSQSGAQLKVAASARLAWRGKPRTLKPSLEDLAQLAALVTPMQQLEARAHREGREGCLVQIA